MTPEVIRGHQRSSEVISTRLQPLDFDGRVRALDAHHALSALKLETRGCMYNVAVRVMAVVARAVVATVAVAMVAVAMVAVARVEVATEAAARAVVKEIARAAAARVAGRRRRGTGRRWLWQCLWLLEKHDELV